MSRLVKVKVKPGQTVQFPSECVNCSRPGSERMLVEKKVGRVTRQIELPLCVDCFRNLNRTSGEEERIGRIGRLAAVIVGLITFLMITLIPSVVLPLWMRLILGATIGLLLALAVFSFFRRKQKNAVLPEKKEVLDSARIVTFSWRATTFEIENEAFADRFADLNEPRLMEI